MDGRTGKGKKKEKKIHLLSIYCTTWQLNHIDGNMMTAYQQSRDPGATRWALSLPTSPLCSSCQTPSAQISPVCLTCPPPAAAAALVEEERWHHLLRLHTVERVEVVVLPRLTQSIHIQHPSTHSPLFIQIPDPSCGSTPPWPYTHTHLPAPSLHTTLCHRPLCLFFCPLPIKSS